MPFPALPATLLAALTERGYAEPTPVQAAVLEAPTAGRDLLGLGADRLRQDRRLRPGHGAELLGEAERFAAPARRSPSSSRRRASWPCRCRAS